MTDTPVVAINGPRQVGKSTLAGELHRMRGGVVITLSAQTHTVRPGQTEGTSRT